MYTLVVNAERTHGTTSCANWENLRTELLEDLRQELGHEVFKNTVHDLLACGQHTDTDKAMQLSLSSILSDFGNISVYPLQTVLAANLYRTVKGEQVSATMAMATVVHTRF